MSIVAVFTEYIYFFSQLMKRTHLSGAAKRAERDKRIKAAVENIPKLTTFYKDIDTTTASITNAVTNTVDELVIHSEQMTLITTITIALLFLNQANQQSYISVVMKMQIIPMQTTRLLVLLQIQCQFLIV